VDQIDSARTYTYEHIAAPSVVENRLLKVLFAHRVTRSGQMRQHALSWHSVLTTDTLVVEQQEFQRYAHWITNGQGRN